MGNDEEINARKEFIYGKIGNESLDILREFGIDVDARVTEILQGQAEQNARLDLKAQFPTANDIMTSELVYKSGNIEDIFGEEYTRRLRLIGLPDDNIRGLYGLEKTTFSVDDPSIMRKEPWVRRYFTFTNSTPETLPKVDNMSLSELILITDDANSAFWRDHHQMSSQAWNALCIAACCAAYTEGRYSKSFNDRTKKLGWSNEQNGAYIRNECLLVERLKWGMHDNPAWTEETTNLK